MTRFRRLRIGAPALAAMIMVGCVFAALALAAEGQLTFSQVQKDGVAPIADLAQARGVATSPDGKNVYAVAQADDAVVTFTRNPVTGALTYLEAKKDGVGTVDGLDGAYGVVVSPDGKNVYASSANDNSLAAFARDPGTGALTFIEFEKDGIGQVDGLSGPLDLAISPDGKDIYVAAQVDDAVSNFSRDPASGAVTYVGLVKNGVAGVTGLDQPVGVTVSADGENVYAVTYTDNSIVTFSRDPDTGALGFVSTLTDGVAGVDGLNQATDVTASADGRNVYASSAGDDALATFSRDSGTGALTFRDVQKDNLGGVDGLDGAFGVVVSPDGKDVYVAGGTDDALVTFSRGPADGTPSFLELEKDGVDGVDGLDGAGGLSASDDGKNVYVGAFNDSAVGVFDREPDLTAPETTIDSGPAGNTADRTPTFTFSSDDTGFTAGFECRVDGGQFDDCISPETIGPLNAGPHTFEVRAVDTAGNADPSTALRVFAIVEDGSADRKVDGAEINAKRSQRQGKRIRVTVEAAAAERVDIVATGAIVVPAKGRSLAKPKSVALGRVDASADAGKPAVLGLRPQKAKGGSKIARLLKHGADLRANLTIKFTDEAANSETKTTEVRLKGKRKGRK